MVATGLLYRRVTRGAQDGIKVEPCERSLVKEFSDVPKTTGLSLAKI